MQEVTVSQKRRINTGNYQSTEIMYSIKKQVLDATPLDLEMQNLSKEIETRLDKQEKEIRDKIEKEAKE